MYHYTESGLDNIWLVNGFEKHKTVYGEGISIQDTEGLHRAIGKWLVNLPKSLNGAELRFLRTEMDVSQKNLAGLLNVEEQALRRWEKNRTKPFNSAADRLLRPLYLSYMEGDGQLRAIVDRLSALDQVESVTGCFRESAAGWTPAHSMPEAA